MDLNKVMLIGNLVADPEVRKLPSGTSLAVCRVATNYSWVDYKTKEKKDSVDFHRIIAWGKLAEVMGTYLKKGQKIFVEGRLNHRQYKDKEGNSRSITEVVADKMIMLGKPSRSTESDKKAEADLVAEEVSIDDVVIEEV